MVSLLNGGLSDRKSNKRPLENWDHSSNSGDAPKYKSRKVSALRFFPPMCGQNAQPMKSEPIENGAVPVGDIAVAGESNGVKTEKVIQNQLHEGVRSPVRVDANGIRTSTNGVQTETKVETQDLEAMKIHISMETDESVKQIDVKDRENVVVPSSDNAVSALEANVVKIETEVEIKSHEVVGSPYSVEGNESLYKLVEEVVAGFTGGVDAGVKKIILDVKPMGIELVNELERKTMPVELPKEVNGRVTEALAKGLDKEESAALVKNMGEDEVKPSVEIGHMVHGVVTIKDDAVPSPKNKFRRRRVSATRGFPPYCGRSAPVLSMQEDPKITSVQSSMGVDKINVEKGVATALMAVPYCPWMQGKVALSSGGGITRGNVNKDKSTWQGKFKAVAKKTIVETVSSGRSSLKKSAVSVHKDADGTLGAVVVRGEGKSSSQDEEPPTGSTAGSRVDVNLPPIGLSSVSGDARNRVRETLRLYQALCRKLLQGEESRSEEDTMLRQSEKIKRIDLQAAKIIKEKGKEVNTGKQYLGAVPGVEVGVEFQYRAELAIVGVHRLYQAGIDSMKHNGVIVATSIVASGAYDDDMENAEVLLYSGQGGNIVGKDKQPEDQKLIKGNLALWNSISTKNPVRVIRGFKETKASDSLDSRVKVVTSYIYDGLYTVENCKEETGTHGKLVYMFELKRIPGQPELAWKEVKKSRKSRVRHGVCVDDIAGGQESLPICAFNTIDNVKPQQFNYIRKMMYPDWFCLVPPKGCDCIGKCSDSRKCSCAQRNGGEIPYNRNGAIVEAKPLVYECGPHCKCPPSCYNRVTQHGIKIQLEIFKTESRGWGVRSLYSIPSGSFICEYVGELLEDNEAELRAGSDEYLFDIGKNYSDRSLNPTGQGNSSGAVEEGGYTIDAAKYGNIGRFINHGCSPNLYAQDVLYDHDDKRMPHVMLFAAENIPPLQELTYHYNYTVGQVHDSNGNIKMKSCYCGSTECSGRMY